MSDNNNINILEMKNIHKSIERIKELDSVSIDLLYSEDLR